MVHLPEYILLIVTKVYLVEIYKAVHKLCFVGCPLILQSDPGTENTIVGALQCVFRHDADDSFAGINSYRVVRSVFNQVSWPFELFFIRYFIH